MKRVLQWTVLIFLIMGRSSLDHLCASGASSQMLPPQSDNWVVVRVWLPKADPDTLDKCIKVGKDSSTDTRSARFRTVHAALAWGSGKNAKVGHVSLQTARHYISLWPSEKAKDFGLLDVGKAVGIFMSLENDLYYEGDVDEHGIRHQCDPEVVVVLNTLNVHRIDDAYESFRGDDVRWNLMGRNFLATLARIKVNSCSGLAYDLLNAGGIKDLCPWDTVSKLWAVSPDAVARVVVVAARSSRETEESGRPLPLGIPERIIAPDYDLNPHRWRIGYALAKPTRCVVM